MSGIFKSAAMSLLSRALQTLLSKYLSEVDVEGVNLPSLYDSDGHSGWGVRLKNVKLRHGVKLRDLPGKLAHVKRKKRKRRHNKQQSKHSNDEAKADDPKQSTDDDDQEVKAKNGIVESALQSEQDGLLRSAAETNPLKTHNTSATVVAESTVDSSTTTTTTSSGWWFWRSSSVAAVAEEKSFDTKAKVECAIETDATFSQPADISNNAHELTLENEMDANSTQVVDTPDEYDESDEDEDGAEIPYILRLGKGGHVGVLDVRLIGSEIHVLVEDGFLIIEAVRVKPLNDAHVTDDANMDKDSTHPPSAVLGKQQSAPPPTKSGSKPKTIGDRVLAENALARYFSAIPNLLLRDLRIQVVIRDQIVNDDDTDENDDDETEFSNDDAIVEICVEFLSITDGGDFLGKYRYKDDDGDDDDDDDEDGDDINNHSLHTSHSKDRASAHTRQEDRIVENQYATKRIRTGRGPDGGVVVRIYPPGQLLRETSELHRRTLWARYCWDSETQYCLLRFSGVDIQSRLFVGTKEDLVSRSFWYTDEYDDYDIDFNIFAGVDYVAPAPQPLPPMIRQTTEILEDKFWEYEGAATYHILDNGIQYSSMKSAFHKVARGMFPNRCSVDHLPCEHCSACWQAAPDIPYQHALDNATPLPGFVLSVVTRDPLELNVDRTSLEVISNFVSLIKKNSTATAGTTDPRRRPSNAFGESSMRDFSELEHEEYSEHFGLSKQSMAVNASESNDDEGEDDSSGQSYNSDDDDITSSYPFYMQPEKIQILGMHLSEVRFRVHVINSIDVDDQRLTFSYYDGMAKCITMDHQRLSTFIKSYSDWRIDIGHTLMKEYVGALNKQLLSCGLRQRMVEFDDATINTMRTMEGQSNRSPWPSTAAALLDMQPPIETLSYEERDRHALQMRFVSATAHQLDKDLSRSLLHVWCGPSVVDIPWKVKDEIPLIIQNMRKIVEGKPPASRSSVSAPSITPIDSVMRYKLHIDGGSFKLAPKIDIRLPLTTLSGERSAAAGIFIETILERVKFRFNEPTSDIMVLDTGLTLQQLIDLPDNIRLSVLLFLDDLGPLSQALCVKFESNTFLLCHSVNKALVKVAKRVARRRKFHGHSRDDDAPKPPSRRQELMTELLKLDDDSLEHLWLHHMRYDRQNSNATPKI
ncbi:hypothetical protein MPSEU_000835900 [Mayamaea pseudoterrestris]|nr:hypothetical protein MPSEU_000835900 [Mayamaea pseudoterrestris]